MDSNQGMAIVILLVFAIVGLAAMVFWILMLINSAKREKWGWFVLQLVFGVIVSIIYRFVDYEEPRRQLRSRSGGRGTGTADRGSGAAPRSGSSAARRRR